MGKKEKNILAASYYKQQCSKPGKKSSGL